MAGLLVFKAHHIYDAMMEISRTDINRLKRDFEEKYARISDEEINYLNDRWVQTSDDLLDFYRIRKELKTGEERQRFLDYLYMHVIAYDKEVFDERYDQPIFNAAFRYAKKVGNTCP